MQLSDYIVEPMMPLIKALEVIDRNTHGIVYICNGYKLEGALTDGDIRRYILRNGDLELPVTMIANKHPRYLSYRERHKAKEMMELYSIQSIPILNDNNEIVDITFIREKKRQIKKSLSIPVVIMAGGKGTRLYPYTQILPKPLIPIGEKTITEHIMDRFKEYGCTHFDMIVNYKKNFIKSYFQDLEDVQDISFIEEEEFLGTGGGLKLLEGRYSSSFFMSNCDILIDEDYGKILDFHKKENNIATIVCAAKKTVIPYGTIEVSKLGQVLKFNEKPQLSFITNTGLYILEPDFLQEIPSNTFIHITDVIQKCIDKNMKIGAYLIPEDAWLDMGQLDELERMRKRLENP